ncbi:hypothetical protein ACWT_4450 [Actinoplanes sp. SE50]|nr:hypothetical protein ACPL_4581 [Actinoplanes sp. SE50/110]ATO83865.1 hypothetical protein ACWT_4450 [Actinoplanes sp. SE50]SLM01275.1 hypothetical protein ACSP50_4511 [Actinoplanes sp. SE50/110]
MSVSRFRNGVPVAVAAVAVWLTVRGRLPDPASIGTMLRTSDGRRAVAAQGLSPCAFAPRRRRLLGPAGVSITRGVATAVTVARSAISPALPAGAAMPGWWSPRPTPAAETRRPTRSDRRRLTGAGVGPA